MGKQKIDDIKNMTDAELQQKIASLKEELYKLNCERKGGRIEKPHRISVTKKGLARIYTIISERKIAKTQNKTK